MQAQFIPGAQGNLFSLYLPAQGECRGSVLCLPPFCEEMNRSRGVMAAQARSFAENGYACLLFDLFGTGDSAGTLQQASWETWLSDAEAASAWLEQASGHVPVLWGIRLGALLAAQMVENAPGRYRQMLFWHPVGDGKTYMTQTLRLRIAALIDREQPAEKTGEMREALQRGESVEIVGYTVPGRLACAIDQLKLKDLDLNGLRIDWIEPVAEGQQALPGAAARLIDTLGSRGCDVRPRAVEVPALWILAERVDASPLVAATSECLAN